MTEKTLKKLTVEQLIDLLSTVKTRFEVNPGRHEGIKWADVEVRLKSDTEKLWSLLEMESTGGEPDVVGFDQVTGEYIFIDCSPESPAGRRSLCYDQEALASRKENKPRHSALGLAAEMGIEILSQEQYHQLQKSGRFDTKTSSWVKTPSDIRQKGGALFCDFRYGHVFVYHNGADSYYASRGFRCVLRV